MNPKFYRTFADFEREEIRPNFKVGFSMEDLVDEASFESTQGLDLDRDPLDWDERLACRGRPRHGSRKWLCQGRCARRSQRAEHDLWSSLENGSFRGVALGALGPEARPSLS